MVAAVATEEPLIAAKPPQAVMVASASPPRRCRARRSRGEQLAAHAGAGRERPIRTNIGMMDRL